MPTPRRKFARPLRQRAATHVGGGVPYAPETLPSPPIPGKTPGPGMPGPYRAAAGKPPAVRKRPRRGQDPSLRTAPSTSARTPPQVRAATRQRAVTHVGGGVPDAPETSRCRPSPGKPPGRVCTAPTARRCGKPYAVRKRPRRGQDPSLRTDPSTSARPAVSSRGYRSTGIHPRRGRRPRRPGNLPSPPIPGKTPGPGLPGPCRAAVGKPHAVRKRPRRGQDPSLRTAPSTSARPPTALT